MTDTIGNVLDRLDAQADRISLHRDAAKVIRRLVEQLSTTETELIDSEFSRYAHVVEIERMTQNRIAAAKANLKRGRHA